MKLSAYINELTLVLEKFGDLDVFEDNLETYLLVEGVAVGEVRNISEEDDERYYFAYLKVGTNENTVKVNAVVVNNWYDNKDLRGF